MRKNRCAVPHTATAKFPGSFSLTWVMPHFLGCTVLEQLVEAITYPEEVLPEKSGHVLDVVNF